jgi:hypothetical protein
MDEAGDYVHSCIRTWVWSGFHDEDAIREMAEEIMEEEDADADVESFIDEELNRKAAAEATWPAQTDCDRIDAVFADLGRQRIVALQNAGNTLDDGFSDVGEVLHLKPKGTYIGYCFYHGQDLERAVAGKGLWLAYADLKDTTAGKMMVGNLVRAAFTAAGFTVSWDGDPGQRIQLPSIEWKRRHRG